MRLTIPVTWGATDDTSGVAHYDVAVRVEDGDWTAWLTGTLATSAAYALGEGEWFSFRVTATDNVGNAGSAEATSSLVRVRKYYYHGGRRVAMRAGGVVYYLHGDHLGSVSLVTAAEGSLHSRQLFLPYGDTRYRAGTLPTDFGFTGQREDSATGLLFMHARYYDARLGQFVSADTVVPGAGSPQRLNRYAYCARNPVKYSDPTGHAYWKGDDGWVIPSTQYNAPIERGWTAHDTKVVAGTMAALVGIAAVPEIVGAVGSGIELPTAAEAVIRTRLIFGTAGGVGSGLGYAIPSLVTGDFDWREFTVATGVGFASGAFPDVGGSGVAAGVIRGVLANETQYVLSSAWTGEKMTLEGHLVSGVTGGLTGALGGPAENEAFNSVQEAAKMYSRRIIFGAPRFANESLNVYTKMTSPAATIEGSRTLLWETTNNVMQDLGIELTTDYSN